MRDIKILVISDDPILNSALANSIEAQVFQWKPGITVFDPHGEPKTQLMNVDDTTIKQLAGECNVEITTMCVNTPREIHFHPVPEHMSVETFISSIKEGVVITSPTEPKADGDHHH